MEQSQERERPHTPPLRRKPTRKPLRPQPSRDQSLSLDGDVDLPLYRRLYRTVARRIAGADWVPGDALPGELELARLYGIAPGTVRKAVDELVGDGLIERRHGSGTFVRRSNFDHAMTRFFLFRDDAGRQIIPESRIISRAVVPATAMLAERLGLRRGEKLIKIVRHRHWDGAPRLLEDIFLPLARFRAILDHTTDEIGPLLYPAYERFCGELVCFIEEEITVVDASPDDASTLRLMPGDAVVTVERLARDAAKRPLEWRRSRGETRRFRYRVRAA